MIKEKIEEEKKYVYNHFYSPKAIFLNIITLGFYGHVQLIRNAKRIGLL